MRRLTRAPFTGRLTTARWRTTQASVPFTTGIENLEWEEVCDLWRLLLEMGAQPGMSVAGLYSALDD